jgi:hypothetical protein
MRNKKTLLILMIFILMTITGTGCSSKTTELPDSPCACLENDQTKIKENKV